MINIQYKCVISENQLFIGDQFVPTRYIPRILQLPNQRECKQNCAKRDSRGAPFIAREVLCPPSAKSENCTPAEITCPFILLLYPFT